jgi:hypothetical protein
VRCGRHEPPPDLRADQGAVKGSNPHRAFLREFECDVRHPRERVVPKRATGQIMPLSEKASKNVLKALRAFQPEESERPLAIGQITPDDRSL